MSPYVAQPYVAGSPEALVIGQTMLAFTQNVTADMITPILEKLNATDIKADEWYPHQLWLDILKEVETTLGAGEASQIFVAFGRQVVENAVMPPELKTIPDVLNALHAIHHANLQNVPEEEGYALIVNSEKDYTVLHNTPNPETAIYGFLWGLAARFRENDEIFVIQKLEENPHPEKARSAYSVKWGREGTL